MEYSFLSATILLILITDPLGNIPLFISCLRGVAKQRRAVVILREVAIAFVILLVFMVAGNRFLRMMGLTDTSLRIGGGIVLFLIASRPKRRSSNGSARRPVISARSARRSRST